MKVDRARFLMLTGALSAATAVGGVAGVGCSTTSDTKDAGTSSSDSGVNDASTDASAEAGDGGACLDDTGEAPDCTTLQSNGCDTTCTTFSTYYKKGVARAIVECLAKLPAPTCESGGPEIATCVDDALAKACADSTAATECAPLAQACTPDGGADAGDGGTAGDAGDAGDGGADGTFSKATCEVVVKGLTSAGRQALTLCVTEGTPGNCSASADTCVGSLKQ